MVNQYGLEATKKNIAIIEDCIYKNSVISLDNVELNELEKVVLLLKLREENKRLVNTKLNINIIGSKLND